MHLISYHRITTYRDTIGFSLINYKLENITDYIRSHLVEFSVDIVTNIDTEWNIMRNII